MQRTLNRWDAVLALLSGTVPVAAYRDVLALGWLYDDPFNLTYILRHRWYEYFSSPSTWRELPFEMYTPMQMLSYEVDAAIFGLQPSGFYLHNLISLSLLSVVTFLVLRKFCSPFWAFWCSIALSTGPVSSVMAQLVMIRHYTEGLLFLGLALLVWGSSAPRRISAAVLFFVSLLYKEVFVIGVLLFLLRERGALPSRLRATVPAFAAAGVFAVVRTAFLGTLGGSYGWSVTAADLPSLIASVTPRSILFLYGDHIFLWLGLAILILWGLVRRNVAPQQLLVGVGLILATTIPFAPVSTVLERRYVLLLSICIGISLILSIATLKNRNIRVVLLLTTLGLSLLMNRQDFRHHQELFQQMTAEQRPPIGLPVGVALHDPSAPPATMHALRELSSVTGNRAFVDWYYDDVTVCDREVSQSVAFSRQAGWHDPVPNLPCERVGDLRHATVTLAREGTGVRWKFSAKETGQWRVMVDDHRNSWEMPSSGAFVFGSDRFKLRVGVVSKSSERWSPWLDISLEERPWRWSSEEVREPHQARLAASSASSGA